MENKMNRETKPISVLNRRPLGDARSRLADTCLAVGGEVKSAPELGLARKTGHVMSMTMHTKANQYKYKDCL
jgi:hypothetical protein